MQSPADLYLTNKPLVLCPPPLFPLINGGNTALGPSTMRNLLLVCLAMAAMVGVQGFLGAGKRWRGEAVQARGQRDLSPSHLFHGSWLYIDYFACMMTCTGIRPSAITATRRVRDPYPILANYLAVAAAP